MATTAVPVRQNVTARTNMPDWVQSFRTDVNRVLDEFGRGFGLPSFRRMMDFEPQLPQPSFTVAAPAVDISEDSSSYKITAELPGLTEKDVDITLSNGALALKGEKRQDSEKKDESYYLSERSYGSFWRTFAVPEGVDRDHITAAFTNGVLTITLPKTPAAQKAERKIEVKPAA